MYVSKSKNIHITTKKNDKGHGFDFVIYDHRIQLRIKKEGERIFVLKFKDKGEITHHKDPGNQFPEIIPSLLLK